MTVDAERLTPILQCTRHLEWFFLQEDKQESKSHVSGYGFVTEEGWRFLLLPTLHHGSRGEERFRLCGPGEESLSRKAGS